jgi:hypothetical protein
VSLTLTVIGIGFAIADSPKSREEQASTVSSTNDNWFLAQGAGALTPSTPRS